MCLLAYLMTHTCMFQILMSLLMCTQEGIANMLRALTTRYEFTCKFFMVTIVAGVIILWIWLSLSLNDDFQTVWKEYAFFSYLVCMPQSLFRVSETSYN